MEKEEIKNLLNSKPSEENLESAIHAIENKKKNDNETSSDLKLVKEIVSKAKESNNETIIDMITLLGFLLEPELVVAANESLKKVAVLKMLDKFAKDSENENNPMKRLLALVGLKALKESLKDDQKEDKLHKGSDFDVDDDFLKMFK